MSEIYHNHIIHNPDGTGKRVSWDLLLLQICIVLPAILDHRRGIAAVDPEKVNIRIIIDNFAAAIWGERDLFQLGIGSQEGGVLLQTVNEADRQGRIISVDALNPRDQGGIIGNGFLLHSPCLVVAEIVVADVEDDGIKQNGADNGSQTGPERGRELCMLCQQDSESENHHLSVEHQRIYIEIGHDEDEVGAKRKQEQ